jgi:hypothetical protein
LRIEDIKKLDCRCLPGVFFHWFEHELVLRFCGSAVLQFIRGLSGIMAVKQMNKISLYNFLIPAHHLISNLFQQLQNSITL